MVIALAFNGLRITVLPCVSTQIESEPNWKGEPVGEKKVSGTIWVKHPQGRFRQMDPDTFLIDRQSNA